MCGLTGFVSHDIGDPASMAKLAERMAVQIRHRGPDDSGVWCDFREGIALAHRRLSIVDLSAAGHQPMASASERFVMVFNGEIYNHLELRSRLQATKGSIAWRGHSDTETLLACIESWGLVQTLRLSVGMFAIALWDRKKRVPVSRSRPDGRKASLLRRAKESFSVWLRAQGLERAPCFRGRDRPRCSSIIPSLHLHSRPLFDFQGHKKASARNVS